MPALRVCLDCPELTDQSRCPTHRRARDRKRGSPSTRGYTRAHYDLRADYQQRMDTGECFHCWRCSTQVDPKHWTLGHCDIDRSVYHGPECPPCDYATAGRVGCPHPSHADISPAA